MRSIEVNNQSDQAVDESRLQTAVDWVLADAGYHEADVSVAIVDDRTIGDLNRIHLQHNFPTDVLSFRLDEQQNSTRLEGEIIVSADTAVREAAHYGWSPADELLLYVVHGALHLIGYDDADELQREKMRDAEAHYLSRMDPALGERHHQAQSQRKQ